MYAFEPFHDGGYDRFAEEAGKMGVSMQKDLSPIWKPLVIGKKTIPNRIAFQPMEGCDGNRDGSPSPLTLRRYGRYARGGAGFVWAEACAVVPEGRANPRHLYLCEENLDAFSRWVEDFRRQAKEAWGGEPVIVLQITHAGRFSRPVPGPLQSYLAWHSPLLDERWKTPADLPIASDEYLDRLPERFAHTAVLAQKAGFDGVDVKCCHRYLASGMLSAFDRPGRYGGSYENRTRLIRDCFHAVKQVISPEMLLCSRLNYYDGMENPGWGMRTDGRLDLTEPLRLTEEMVADGLQLLNVTMGSPYYNSHVNRPSNQGGDRVEHPMEGVHRLMEGAKAAQEKVPTLATGFSWMRQYGPYAAAAALKKGQCSLAGFGRMNLAYPDFPMDLKENGKLDADKCCIGCGLCTKMMRAGGVAGCPVRDQELYLEEYRRLMSGKGGTL